MFLGVGEGCEDEFARAGFVSGEQRDAEDDAGLHDVSLSVTSDGGLVGEPGRGDGCFGLPGGEFDLGPDPAAPNGRPPATVGLGGPDGQTASRGDAAEGEVVGG
ncbi:hypothetical protein [Amycolatopsis sp. WGS_07]|uniref:hypothetical protein n=1 Tax=Amycolatopsis sp. WGS_07 TaxID=3076764 RepID=UPI0038736BF6